MDHMHVNGFGLHWLIVHGGTLVYLSFTDL